MGYTGLTPAKERVNVNISAMQLFHFVREAFVCLIFYQDSFAL